MLIELQLLYAAAGVAGVLLLALIALGVQNSRLRRRLAALELELVDDQPDPTAETELLPALEPPPRAAPEPPAEEPPAEPSALERFRRGLAATSATLGGRLGSLFRREHIDAALYEELEEALIGADVGVRTATTVIDALKARVRSTGTEDPEALQPLLRDVVSEILKSQDPSLAEPPDSGPYVILVVGVNGSGKTTTIGKLAARFKAEGKSVLMGAGDTFRAGAIDQLKIWSERAGAEFVAHQPGADPAAVLYDALESAIARDIDVVICDTAGRLQSQKPLMDELAKVHRVLAKAAPGAPHEVLLVLDGTMGQNALQQARIFGEVTGVTGVVLTKLDGTAKGGVVVAVASDLGLPVKFIGIGEAIDDLRPFEAEAFVDALLTPAP